MDNGIDLNDLPGYDVGAELEMAGPSNRGT